MMQDIFFTNVASSQFAPDAKLSLSETETAIYANVESVVDGWLSNMGKWKIPK